MKVILRSEFNKIFLRTYCLILGKVLHSQVPERAYGGLLRYDAVYRNCTNVWDKSDATFFRIRESRIFRNVGTHLPNSNFLVLSQKALIFNSKLWQYLDFSGGTQIHINTWLYVVTPQITVLSIWYDNVKF